MTYCTECCAVEQGRVEKEIDGETIEVCAMCESDDDTLRNYDEDYGQDR